MKICLLLSKHKKLTMQSKTCQSMAAFHSLQYLNFSRLELDRKFLKIHTLYFKTCTVYLANKGV